MEPSQARLDGRTSAMLLNSTGAVGERDSNPHELGTLEHKEWDEGWQEVMNSCKSDRAIYGNEQA